jgi:hypothetical protein
MFRKACPQGVRLCFLARMVVFASALAVETVIDSLQKLPVRNRIS